jgi:DNA-binding NarL/FixJ family response regulator
VSPLHRILLVDDFAMIRGVVREYLNETIPELEIVGEASNGLEAIELADRLKPELILMDVRMPLVDGIQATQVIKSGHPEIVVITYSGSEDETLPCQSSLAGAVAHYTKPLDLKSLRDKILELMAGDQAKQAGCM